MLQVLQATIYQTTQTHISYDSSFQTHQHENLKLALHSENYRSSKQKHQCLSQDCFSPTSIIWRLNMCLPQSVSLVTSVNLLQLLCKTICLEPLTLSTFFKIVISTKYFLHFLYNTEFCYFYVYIYADSSCHVAAGT